MSHSDESVVQEIRDNPDENRYEAVLTDGELAVLDYRIEGDRILFTHTGTPPKHRHKGIAARLTRHALDDAIDRGLKIAPYCPYTSWFIGRNPEYRSHLAEGSGR